MLKIRTKPIIDKETFDYVQQEMARRKGLGPFANKSLNTTCFTGKIKCGICGRSFMHNLRKDRGFQEFWDCGSHKLAGRSCGAKGSIPQAVLIRECTAVLGLDNFDENVFLDRVDKIVVPKHHVMVFHMKDGREITRHWISTAKKDCWTDEYKDEQRAWMRNYMANGTNTRYYPFTTRIKCALCGHPSGGTVRASRVGRSPIGDAPRAANANQSACGKKIWNAWQLRPWGQEL
jgi:site-specific DNA recombinase